MSNNCNGCHHCSIYFSFLIITLFQQLMQFHPGNNVGLGRDHTIFSLIDGMVKFEKFGPDKKKVSFRLQLATSPVLSIWGLSNFTLTKSNRLVFIPEKSNPRTPTVTEHERGSRSDYNASGEKPGKKAFHTSLNWYLPLLLKSLKMSQLASQLEELFICLYSIQRSRLSST